VATCSGYYALRIGRVGVVAPVVGAYGAVTAALSWLGGERMSGLAAAGLAFTVAGVVVVSVPPAARAHPARGTASGLLPALVACTGYGLPFWIQGRFAVPLLGAVLPVWMYYAFSTAVLAVVAAATRPPLLLAARDMAVILGTAALAVSGFVIVSAGLATGHVAVVVVLTSLQSAISVGLACLLQGERLARHQWLGVAAVVAGLALVRAG
jgi:drug/metabolite transporter (DMT)-like permease